MALQSSSMGLDPALFEGSVPKDLLCAMCGGVLVQPEMSACKHVFCSTCLRQNVTLACKICGTTLQLTSFPLPTKLCSRLLDLRIRCDHKCGQTVPLSELPRHVSEECPNTPVSCLHVTQGCRKLVRRCQNEEHAAECDFRPVVCEACGHKTLHKDLLAHQSKRRCVELKLKHQLIQAVRLTRGEIRRHKKHLDRQQVRVDQHNRRIEMDHIRNRKLNTARHLNQMQHNYNTALPTQVSGSLNSLDSVGSTFNEQRIPSRSAIPAINRIPPSRLSMNSRGGSKPVSKDGTSLVSNVPSTDRRVSKGDALRPISKGSEGMGGPRLDPRGTVPVENSGLFLTAAHEEEPTNDMFTPHTPKEDIFVPGSHQCRNCKKSFRENLNKANSCRWHAGPIIELFGGTCYSCGRLDYQAGCMMGFHEF